MDKAKAKKFLDRYPTLGVFFAAVYDRSKDSKGNKLALIPVRALGELVNEHLDGIVDILHADRSPVTNAHELHLQKAYEWVASQT